MPPQRATPSSGLMRPLVVLALPGMYLLYKYNQYRQQQMETARRRVTERELMHLNTKIINTPAALSPFSIRHKLYLFETRGFASRDDDCAKAFLDKPDKGDPECPKPCDRKLKKPTLMNRIKLKILEGGSNFGTPFRRVKCPSDSAPVSDPPAEKTPYLPQPQTQYEENKEEKPKRPGIQVSIMGADTLLGQYIAFLLKQCSSIRRLRLYEATDSSCNPCTRDLCQVVQDLQHIDTNCTVQGFSCTLPHNLEACLQNTDLVLILESALVCPFMSTETRFYTQAGIVKQYADNIASQCPSAFILVCSSPIDCMVPLIAETLKVGNAYNPCKLLGSLAVPEMRASTIAARALSLEPKYLRVPCIGGTEGLALVPLFSRAVEYFDFSECNARALTEAVRSSCCCTTYTDHTGCEHGAELSEAHAITGLVLKIAHSLLCNDTAVVTGFVDACPTQVISPLRYVANAVRLNGTGIFENPGLPKMNEHEKEWFSQGIPELNWKLKIALDFHCKYWSSSSRFDKCQLHFFFTPKPYKRFEDSAYAFIYRAVNVKINGSGIFKTEEFPKLSPFELLQMNVALDVLTKRLEFMTEWRLKKLSIECMHDKCSNSWYIPKYYERLQQIAGE